MIWSFERAPACQVFVLNFRIQHAMPCHAMPCLYRHNNLVLWLWILGNDRWHADPFNIPSNHSNLLPYLLTPLIWLSSLFQQQKPWISISHGIFGCSKLPIVPWGDLRKLESWSRALPSTPLDPVVRGVFTAHQVTVAQTVQNLQRFLLGIHVLTEQLGQYGSIGRPIPKKDILPWSFLDAFF